MWSTDSKHSAQGLWKGVLPSLVMVSNPTVNYVLYEWLLARLAELKRKRSAALTGTPGPEVHDGSRAACWSCLCSCCQLLTG